MNIRNVFSSIVLLSVLPLTSCETIQGLSGDQVAPVLQTVTALTANITEWQKTRGEGEVSDQQLKKLNGFAEESGNAKSTLDQLLGSLSEERKEQLMPVKNGLSQLASYDLSALMGAEGSKREEGVNEFVGIAASLQSLVKNLDS